MNTVHNIYFYEYELIASHLLYPATGNRYKRSLKQRESIVKRINTHFQGCPDRDSTKLAWRFNARKDDYQFKVPEGRLISK